MGLIELVESRIREIPTLPIVANRVVTLLNNPKSSASDLEKVIKHDQALAARVLKLVNSAYYGFPRRITTVGQGIVILGYKAIKELVLSVSIAELFRMKGNNKIFDRTALWQHSVCAAVGAKLLARKATLPLEDEAFIAGLLHDIGVLILDGCLTTEFEEIISLTTEGRLPLIKAEERVLGFNHTVVGKMLAEKWNFPPLLVEVLRYHHRPFQNKSYWATAALVFSADNLAQEAGVGFLEGYDAGPDFKSKVWEWLGLKPQDKEVIFQQLKQEMKRAVDFLDLASTR
ncbi:MAG TPA: hydrolase [Firmicutes bacterium]|nr:hydrolase [Bacillota bacterium]HBK67330.1 hydrolase [Bacillota bacterium]